MKSGWAKKQTNKNANNTFQWLHSPAALLMFLPGSYDWLLSHWAPSHTSSRDLLSYTEYQAVLIMHVTSFPLSLRLCDSCMPLLCVCVRESETDRQVQCTFPCDTLMFVMFEVVSHWSLMCGSVLLQGCLLHRSSMYQEVHRPGVCRENYQHKKALGQRWAQQICIVQLSVTVK